MLNGKLCINFLWVSNPWIKTHSFAKMTMDTYIIESLQGQILRHSFMLFGGGKKGNIIICKLLK